MLLSPNTFVSQFQNHFWPSTPSGSTIIGNITNKSTESLFKQKEEQINNLMKVNIMFKNNIELFYEFYCIQLYLTNEMISILKQLCVLNAMLDDVPTNQELVEGFLATFVAPIYNQRNHPNDKEIKEQLQINKYPIDIKNAIKDIANRMLFLLRIGCSELQLNDDEKVLDYFEEYKSVSHHTLELRLLGYKSLLSGLRDKYTRYNAIGAYIHTHCCTQNQDIIQQIEALIRMSFYCPFGIHKTNEQIKELIYDPFQSACGKPVAFFLTSSNQFITKIHLYIAYVFSFLYMTHAPHIKIIKQMTSTTHPNNTYIAQC
eukprot:115994_1